MTVTASWRGVPARDETGGSGKQMAQPGQAARPRIEFDLSVEAGDWPSPDALHDLTRRAVDEAFAELASSSQTGELSLVFTDDEGMRALNARWRGKNNPTNVLSFP